MNQHNLQSGTIETIDIKNYHGTERTEEVRDIVERMPRKFGLWISLIVTTIFSLLIIFGWIIRYPDVVSGQITVNTSIAPIKLVANASGKIKLNIDSSQSMVDNSEVIGYIESPTSYDTLSMIKKVLANYNPTNNNTAIITLLPSKAALGELTSKYYAFLSSLHQLANFNNDKLYDKQIESLKHLRKHQLDEVTNSDQRIDINKDVVGYASKFLKRDSILYEGKVSAEAEFDKTKMNYLTSQAGYSNAKSSQIDAKKQSQQTLSQITEINVRKSEKKNELEISLLAAYNDLMSNITVWEQNYLFKSPFKGRVQFLRFWTNNQFVQSGQPVFTIVPDAQEPYGQVLLPAVGAGKVKNGQEVIIKLDDFPYNEYGSITGTIGNISLTTNTEKTEQGNMEVYLVTVKFPNGLTTNYGKPIDFRHEAKGSAEVITKDRRLIERLFDNLKYALNK